MPSDKIKVLITEDSLTIRYQLTALIDESPELQVVGTARDGVEALRMVELLSPDVISMDVKMPEMDGLEATRRIMRTHPTPVVIVSNLVEKEIDLSFRALQAGALAVVPRPASRTDPDFARQQHKLLSTLQAMAGVKVVRRWATVYEVTEHRPREYNTHKLRPAPALVAVAASAGGPSALATLLGGLRSQLTVPIVVVQHMPDEFIGGLARWMSKFTDLPVQIVEDNAVLKNGMVYLAPGDAHVRVYRRESSFITKLDRAPGRYRHQPSADVLFESVAGACGERGVGIILTGMGDDSAAAAFVLCERACPHIAHGKQAS
ncbi:MAG: chemotaxis protein CheB, partial [Chloroflexota bacterium]